ncbi:MAG: DUF3489 domain-containing protein [Alphaproteobacteria bacterium]|nr:DUF3489 domain-containing protein [Alphaproteobacteria bacterium]
MKLTDSQLVILSAAAKRDDGAILPLLKSVKLNKGAVTLVLKSLLKHKLVTERDAAPGDEAWREQRDGRRCTLAITNAGLKALGVEAAPESKATQTKPESVQRKADVKTTAAVAKNPLRAPKRKGTKLSLLIDLMKRKGGATIEEAAKATGWQHHSVRGAISGALKKKRGLEVTSTSVEGRGRVYRIPAQA